MLLADLEGQCPCCPHEPFSADWKLRAHLRRDHHGTREQEALAPDSGWDAKKAKRRNGQHRRGKDVR